MNREVIHTASYIKDYPRPQLVRSEWTNLNGEWEFAFDDGNKGEALGWNKGFDTQTTIKVPFTYETRESGIGDESVHEHVWYQRLVSIKKREGKRYILHLEGSDYHTKVWVNGDLTGDHKGAYERASFDITDRVIDGDNLIVIGISDSLSIRQPRGKQRWRKENFGCWYVQTTGIWKTVWLEEVAETHIGCLSMTPCIRSGKLKLDAEIFGGFVTSETGDVTSISLEGEVSFGGRFIRSFLVNVNADHVSVDIDVKDHGEFEWGIHTWSPEVPDLYDLKLSLKKDGEVVDEVASYFGMREVRTDNGKVLLNGRPIFQKLILDQGYWKDTHLSPPSEEALVDDIDKIQSMGFNGLRKHMKVEDERFLYWCDVKGMLVWSEMAACYLFDSDAVKTFTDEWLSIVRDNYNHPSIITWTPFNESWGVPTIETDVCQQKFTEGIYQLTKSIDPTRPVITNDGWEHTVSDILTLHDYEEKGEVFAERYTRNRDDILNGRYAHNRDKKALAIGYEYKGQPVIISEYGGIAFTTSKEEEWGYGNTVKTEEEFLDRYKSITDAIASLPYVTGFCYTQVSDVQQEVNGLLTADRKFKVNPDKIREINENCTEP